MICTVFPHFGPFSGGGKPNFADKNFMDTQTFLIICTKVGFPPVPERVPKSEACPKGKENRKGQKEQGNAKHKGGSGDFPKSRHAFN